MWVGECEQVKSACFIIKPLSSSVKSNFELCYNCNAVCYRTTANTLDAKAKLEIMWCIGYIYKIISECLELVEVSVQCNSNVHHLQFLGKKPQHTCVKHTWMLQSSTDIEIQQGIQEVVSVPSANHRWCCTTLLVSIKWTVLRIPSVFRSRWGLHHLFLIMLDGTEL